MTKVVIEIVLDGDPDLIERAVENALDSGSIQEAIAEADLEESGFESVTAGARFERL